MIQEELLEIWDWNKGEPTGLPVARGKAHREGIAHEGVHLWIVRNIYEETEILLQRRAASKALFPGYLDITVGGHVPFGLQQNKVQKEAEEELGIVPADAAMIDLGYYKYEEHTPEYDLFHREFQHVYLLHDNRPLREYCFADGEVSGLAALRLDDFEHVLMTSQECEATYFDGSSEQRLTLTRADFHPLFYSPPMGHYLAVLLAAIREYGAGKKVQSCFSKK